MPVSVFLLVLCAAALHAWWNAIVKGASDKLVASLSICMAASVIAACVLPFAEQPARESWPFIGLSVALQVVYYMLVAAAYRRVDMSAAYPVMRGGAPIFVALSMAAFFSEALSAAGWVGVATISAGILAMAAIGRAGPRAGMGFAVLNACVIASYTLSDGIGVRLSGAPIGYTLWIFLLTAFPLAIWAYALQGRAILISAAACWREGVLGGIGTMLSYGVALWAMTRAPIAMVAALRETSILFALLLSAVLLGERPSRGRIAAAAMIGAGAAILRLA